MVEKDEKETIIELEKKRANTFLLAIENIAKIISRAKNGEDPSIEPGF